MTFRSLILLLLSTHPEPHLPSNKPSLRYSREQHGTPFPRPNFRSSMYVKTADTHITRFCPFVPSLIPSPTRSHTGDSDRMEQRWVCLSTCGLSRGLRGRACHVAPASPRLFPEWLLPPAYHRTLSISPPPSTPVHSCCPFPPELPYLRFDLCSTAGRNLQGQLGECCEPLENERCRSSEILEFSL